MPKLSDKDIQDLRKLMIISTHNIRRIESRVRELVATEVEDWGAATKTGVAQIAYSIRNLDVQPERTSA